MVLNIFENNYTAMLLIDPLTAGIVDANPAACSFFGHKKEELLKKKITNVIDIPLTKVMLDSTKVNKMQYSHFYGNYRLANAIRKLDIYSDPVRIRERRYLQLIIRDITEQEHKQSENSIPENEEKFRELFYNADDALFEQIFNTAGDGMRVVDENFNILRVNEAFCRLSGFSKPEAEGNKCYDVFPSNECKSSKCPLNLISSGKKRIEYEVEKKCKDGSKVPCILTATPFVAPDGSTVGMVENFKDITERKKAEETIKRLAYYDMVTGLPNRVLLHDRLASALDRRYRSEGKLALMLLDLDRFKRVNDWFGHISGDRLLKEVAKRLKSCVRDEDVVARIGGDEFVILLTSIDKMEDAVEIAERILQVVKKTTKIDDQEISITISIGIAFFPSDGQDVETLLQKADDAMYRAKNSGKNNYEVYSL